jgi:hypothetical protein
VEVLVEMVKEELVVVDIVVVVVGKDGIVCLGVPEEVEVPTILEVIK